MSLLFENIGSLLTLHPLASERRGYSVTQSDLGLFEKAWLFCEGTKITALGTGPTPKIFLKRAKERRDLSDCFVMPGMVDSHTHAIFGGDRSSEFVQRLNGATYQDIAKAGGGIAFTREATRQATDKELIQSTLKWIEKFQKHGVTTLEIKTGYGLSVEHELRLARLLKKLDTRSYIVRTCLALHDHSPEFPNSFDYIEAVCKDLLPILAREDLVSYVDAFVEKGYYLPSQLERYLQTAKDLKLGIRLHADEFSNAEGAQCAARWGAASADHLQWASDEDAKALAEARTTATLLPGTSLYTGIPFTDARRFFRAGCAVAIASDFNPGSSFLYNLHQLASIGAIHCHLTSYQALAAVTYVPALSLGLGAQKGALSPSFDADFLVYKMKGPDAWLADMGQTLPNEVWIRGAHLKS